MQSLHAKRKFSPEEKQQLLANLDIEVEHRTRQLESWLTDALENFRNHHEGHPSRIPRIVLGVKMRDLQEKYNGDVQVCVRALQMDKLVGLGAGVGEERATKKRKWLAGQESEKEAEAEGSRGVKNGQFPFSVRFNGVHLWSCSENRCCCHSKEETSIHCRFFYISICIANAYNP